jgi:uncharacterized protein DUF6894
MRYFFDIVTAASVLHDFQGRTFATPEPAHSLAELIALDMECSDFGHDVTEVAVRDVKGDLLFSVHVRPRDLLAA